MRSRHIALIPLSIVIVIASSFASVCDVSCLVAQFHPITAAMNYSYSTSSVNVNLKVAVAPSHSCCQNRGRGSAIIVPHLAMSPDCAVDPSLRSQSPRRVEARDIPVSTFAIQSALVPINSLSAAETPPLSVESYASSQAASPNFSVLRI